MLVYYQHSDLGKDCQLGAALDSNAVDQNIQLKLLQGHIQHF